MKGASSGAHLEGPGGGGSGAEWVRRLEGHDWRSEERRVGKECLL